MIRKISITTGTRSEYGLLRPLIEKISQDKNFQLYLIVTGMHLSKKYGLTIREIKNDGFKISAKINMIPNGDSMIAMSDALGRGIVNFSKVFKKIKPDINIILGDRDEAFASAIAASHMNIPNAHIHGGDKSKAGIDEYNRHAITKLSNIHFAATRKSAKRILKMGENPKFIVFSGSPGIDEIKKNKISSKNFLEKKYRIRLTGKEIILLQHPVTTQVKQSSNQIKNTLDAISKTKLTTIAIAPNSDAGNKAIFNNLKMYSKKYSFIKVYKNIPRADYLGFLRYCGVLVGNSSSGIIEASYFSIPVINIGIRQDNRETGRNVTNIKNFDQKQIHSAIKKALKIKNVKNCSSNIYGDGNSSEIIIKFLSKLKINDELLQKQIHY